jgi:CRISPR-associated protein Csm5
MNKVLVETLTPLHIGSGRTLLSDTEYLYFSETHTVSVIDEHKILSIIGSENIDQWVHIIEKGSGLLDYLKKRSSSKVILPSQTDKRLLNVNGKSNPTSGNSGIREQLFSGNGQPILPGSSLKGAIRTAMLNRAILKNPSNAKRINDFKEEKTRTNYRTGQKEVQIQYKGVRLEKKYFGRDPNHDIFRMLRVGDTHFTETECILAETLNETGTGQEIKHSVQQHIECIPASQSALCGIQIPQDLIKEVEKRPDVLSKMKGIESIKTLPLIFGQINAHSKNHIEQEIKKYELLDLPIQADSYVETLKDILESYQNLSENECILRVGFGTGYLSMTGGWPIDQWKNTPDIDYKNEMNDLATAVRRNPKYNGMALPKSRKIVLGGIPLGFIKLKLLSRPEAEAWQVDVNQKALEAEARKKEALAAAQKQAEVAAIAAEKAEGERLKAEHIDAEEAKKPQMLEGKVKKGDIIDAEVIKVEQGKKATLKFYAEGQEKNIGRTINYNGILTGDILLVRVKMLSKKNEIVAAEFVNYK